MKTKDTKGTEVITTVRSKRQDKKNINIRPRTVRYFQFGLLIGLFAVLLILEANIGFATNSYTTPKDLNLVEEPTYIFALEKKQPIAKAEEPVKRVVQKKLLTDIFKTTKENTPLIEAPIKSNSSVSPVVTPVAPTETPTVPAIPKTTESKNVLNVEFVPVFPGCESFFSNSEKLDCMSSKINDFIGRKFRTNDFNHLEQGDEYTIYTFFTINTEGLVTNIKARVSDKKLEKEAIRVISQLPLMKAGKQGDKQVNVQYSIPITFKVHN